MSLPKTPAQRTTAARTAQAAVTAYPVVNVDPMKPPIAPTPFDGTWFHSTSVRPEILLNGWKPDLVKNTIYGAAVYLARTKWDAAHPDIIECKLDLVPAVVMSTFTSQWAKGAEENHLLWHLKDNGLTVGRNASPGASRQNQAIAAYFKAKSIKAIWLTEHGTEVVAVYDPSCIRVVP